MPLDRQPVTALQRRLFELLRAAGGRVLSEDAILDALWGPRYERRSNVVARHVANLRAALGDDRRAPRHIETVRGRGYRFVADGKAPA
jgi:two-component system, OmpR family, alkaline phosphatase synthesis response regulator PhoP